MYKFNLSGAIAGKITKLQRSIKENIQIQDEFQADKERLERLKASETEAEVKQYKEYKEKFNKAREERRKSEISLSNIKSRLENGLAVLVKDSLANEGKLMLNLNHYTGFVVNDCVIDYEDAEDFDNVDDDDDDKKPPHVQRL